MNRHIFRSMAALILISAASITGAAPNVVVILVDDAGLMDFGGYGGEARTPTINQLADSGVRFSNFHTSPLCSTSRAMLLTGQDNHLVGVGTIPEVIHDNQRGLPAYELRLKPGVTTIASMLKAAGYSTFMTGKWHLGQGPQDLPQHHGFDRSFVLDASGADNWEHKSFLPFYEDAPWYADGEPARLPDDFYSSTFIVDQMMKYLDARDSSKPFFSYLAFLAIHIPVQAPAELVAGYEDIYRAGWDALRQQRIAQARQLGLMPADAPSPEPHPLLRAWKDLSPDEQHHYRANMMVNAAMLEAMDTELGRLVAYLDQQKELDNTLFVITSDNGPEFGDPAASPIFRLWMAANDYHTNLDNAGERGFMGAIGPEWASVAAVPGSLFKMYASEGGTRVPLIISGAGVKPAGGFNNTFSFVTDIAPTVAALAGLKPPDTFQGVSLAPLLSSGEPLSAHRAPVLMETAGNAALFHDGYKLVKNTRPHGDATWRLFQIEQDPAERFDLSATNPELKNTMLQQYKELAVEFGIVALPLDFDVQQQIAVNTVPRLIAANQFFFLSVGIVVVLLLLLVLRQVKRAIGNKQ